MQETIALIFSYIWGVWRFRWLALVVTWVVALGGWLFGLFGANLGAGIIGSVITATIGAIILLWIVAKLKN